MKIIADRDRCCGAGVCVTAAPKVFDLCDDDGLVVLKNEGNVHTDDIEDVLYTIEGCPSNCLSIETEE